MRSICTTVRCLRAERFAKLFAGRIAWHVLADGVVDAFIQENYGLLSPARCVALLMGQRPLGPAVAAAPPVAVTPAPQPDRQAIPAEANPLQAPTDEAAAAINECRAKRLSGELKAFAQSAQCSNPRIIAAFEKTNYRYLDLIVLMTAKRMQIVERLDIRCRKPRPTWLINRRSLTWSQRRKPETR